MGRDLEALRSELNALDRRLLECVAERQRLVEEIGHTKQESGRGTRDFEREKQVLDRARENARDLDLDPELASTLMTELIRASLTRQESDRVRAEGQGANQRALVFGGGGKMGRWFVEFLASQGYSVAVHDPAAAAAEPSSSCDNWEDRLDEFDLIVLAAPIRVCAELLERLAVLRPRGVIFDIASLKSPLRIGLRSLADAGCAVCSVHPMFGPDTRLLSGRHVILVDLGHGEALERAGALFSGTMAEVTSMSLEDHDRVVAYILGLSHVLNIAFFTALRESGEASERLGQLSSTTFEQQLGVGVVPVDQQGLQSVTHRVLLGLGVHRQGHRHVVIGAGIDV